MASQETLGNCPLDPSDEEIDDFAKRVRDGWIVFGNPITIEEFKREDPTGEMTENFHPCIYLEEGKLYAIEPNTFERISRPRLDQSLFGPALKPFFRKDH